MRSYRARPYVGHSSGRHTKPEYSSRLQLNLAEPERVSDHGHRTESHGSTSQHGAQQDSEEGVEYARGDRNSNHVIREGEK